MKIRNIDIDINTDQIKADLTATHPNGTKLSFLEKTILLIKHNPLIVIAIIYSLSPIDLIPDTLPFIGSLDDTIVLLVPIFKLFQEILDTHTQTSPADAAATSGTSQPQVSDAINQTDNVLNETNINASGDSMPK